MKVVTASTSEQQQYVKELIDNLFETIFPYFYSLDYIQQMKEFKLMDVPQLENLSLTEIMEVTAAIQTISSILEETVKSNKSMSDYDTAFHKNCTILAKYDIDFPFELNDFSKQFNVTHVSDENTLYI